MRKTGIRGFVIALVSTLAVSSHFCAEEAQPKAVSALPGEVPSDAVVLFDGKNLSEWVHTDGTPASWVVSDGTMTVAKGGIKTKKEFGDIQIHLEFRTPAPARGEDQDRGNSGVYIQGNYEVQILDSYINETYIDGMCGAVYKMYPPLVNVSRPPGIWQSYDIIFRAPKLDRAGKVVKKATVTVLHNGVLIQDHVEVEPTGGRLGSAETARGPIFLQDHNHPVQFRNIWVREL
jgi:hypothetical protein